MDVDVQRICETETDLARIVRRVKMGEYEQRAYTAMALGDYETYAAELRECFACFTALLDVEDDLCDPLV